MSVEHSSPVGAALEFRARVLRATRRFFDARGYVEVETPVRVAAPAPEPHIDAEPSGDRFLRTSPELHMKRLLAGGLRRLYQVGPCFRRGERGAHHHPEFTMLEWYRADADYLDMLDETRAFIRETARAVLGGTSIRRGGRTIDTAAPWPYLPVSEAFRRWAGWDPAEAFDADRFDLDLVDRVEPSLPRETPCVLIDYPAPAAALARLKAGDPLRAERWELYLDGVELANAYSELTDPAEQRLRFAEGIERRRAAGRAVYPVDEAFLAGLARLPPTGGVALGFDRLVMVLAGTETLDGVLAFHE